MENTAINPNLIGTKISEIQQSLERLGDISSKGKAGLPMDVKILNHAPIAFRYEVTRGEVIFSRDEEARLRFVENTWNEYLDYKPVAENILRELAA